MVIAECDDGVEQSTAVADRRDTELAQILARQPAQHLPVNVVAAESGPILFEPEPTQPFGHIHRSCPETAEILLLGAIARVGERQHVRDAWRPRGLRDRSSRPHFRCRRLTNLGLRRDHVTTGNDRRVGGAFGSC